MTPFTRILLLAFSLVATAAGAQECADWSRSPSLPHVEPSITGNVCRLDRGTAYVAGAEFMVVDVSTWDRPLVTGRVVLPAAAQDLAVAWPRAWAACGEAGIVELDIVDSAAPFIARVYDPALAVTKVIEIDGAVIGLDSGSHLHYLAVEAEGPLVARSVRAWRETVLGLTKASGHLVVSSASRISVVNVHHISASGVTSSIEAGWSPYGSAITADRDRVVLVQVFLQEGAYAMGYIAEITTYAVDGTGLITRIGSKSNLADTGLAVAAAGGWLLQTTDSQSTSRFPGTTIRVLGDLDVKARLPFGGRSLDRCWQLVVAVGTAGLSTLELPSDLSFPSAIDVRGDFDPVVGPGFNSTTFGAMWTPRLGVLTTTGYYYSGASYDGGQSRRVRFTVVDGHDPESWLEVLSDSFYDSQFRESDCALATLEVEEFPDGIAVLVWGNDCTLRVTIVDVDQRCIRGHINETGGYSETIGVAATGRILWVDGVSGTRCFDVTSATPSAPINTVPLVRSGLRLAPDDQLLVVYVEAAHEFDLYDMSDVNDVRHLATWTAPSGGYVRHLAWIGRRLAYVAGTVLCVVDFSAPATPVLLSTTMLPRSPTALAADGSRLVLDYEWTTYSPATSHRQFQVADIAKDGTAVLHVAWDVEAAVRDRLVSGDVVYADHETAIRAYDIRDPDAPALIGTALSGRGSLAIVGDYLATGSILTSRDCRDLRQLRRIAIGVQPILKPGPPSDYAGPALVPVVVRGAPGFDPGALDTATVRFGPAGAGPVSGPADKSRLPGAGGGPGATDRLFWFRLDQTGVDSATEEVRLTARTFAGEDVLGIAWLDVPAPQPSADDTPALTATPNPFNPQTTLNFTLLAAGPAQLAIYNLQGQRVRVLVEEVQAPGWQSVVWDGMDDRGSAVASGVYIARLVGDGKSATQRLALVR